MEIYSKKCFLASAQRSLQDRAFHNYKQFLPVVSNGLAYKNSKYSPTQLLSLIKNQNKRQKNQTFLQLQLSLIFPFFLHKNFHRWRMNLYHLTLVAEHRR
jgi:hypothetical protein